jgi:hypothetical protein
MEADEIGVSGSEGSTLVRIPAPRVARLSTITYVLEGMHQFYCEHGRTIVVSQARFACFQRFYGRHGDFAWTLRQTEITSTLTHQ